MNGGQRIVHHQGISIASNTTNVTNTTATTTTGRHVHTLTEQTRLPQIAGSSKFLHVFAMTTRPAIIAQATVTGTATLRFFSSAGTPIVFHLSTPRSSTGRL